MRNVSGVSGKENQNIGTSDVYEMMWKKHGRAREATDDNIIRRMRFACSITKATYTQGICNAYCFSTATVVTRTRLSVNCNL